jgi:carbonic anhydrase
VEHEPVTRIDDILDANARYAATFEAGPQPDPRIALVLCMDARIDPIRALGLPYGSAHIIRNAGGRVQDALRSLAVSQAVIGTEEVMIVHHTECAMAAMDDAQIAARLNANGRSVPEGFPFLTFSDLEQVARDDLAAYRASPLVRQDIPVRTFTYEVATGHVREVTP